MSLTRFSKKTTSAGGRTGKQHLLPVLAVVLTATFSLGLGLTLRAAAGPGDKKVTVTFSSPVEIPGKALPAGTYVFKVLDDVGGRDIVQVFDKDEKELLATLLAIPDYRDPPPGKPTINFEERASNAPPAVKALYLPGDTYGLEFVYPQERAVQLAKRTGQNVLSMSNDNKQNMAAPASSANASFIRWLSVSPSPLPGSSTSRRW